MKREPQVKLTITDINAQADGVARLNEKVHFVPGAVPGDVVLAQVVDVKKTYNRAVLLNVIQPSRVRVEPPCCYAEHCGGCSVQHIDYAAQLHLKEELVRSALARIGGFDALPIAPILAMKAPYRYRNKAVFPAAKTADGLTFGLYQPRSHRVVPIDDCLIQQSSVAAIVQTVRDWANQFGVSAYDEQRDRGVVRHVMVRSNHRGQHMVGIVSRTIQLPHASSLVARLKQHDDVVSVVHNSNQHKGNRILGASYRALYGEDLLVDRIAGIDYQLSMASFFQVNRQQTDVLYRTVGDLAALSGREIVWDIYCGAGSIALQMANRAKWVYGNEIVPQAIENAKANAALNGIKNVTFVEGAAENIVPSWLNRDDKPDVVILDPPRKGADAAVLQAILDLSPQRIIYVSCKPSTLARDLHILCQDAYHLVRVTPVDMFPHTMHVECVVLLSR